jgi:Flp pilus assembly protein TadG
MGKPETNSRSGSSMVEFAMLVPWFLFLFVGILDMGFYNYALITAQSAARTAALWTSASSSNSTDAWDACTAVYDQLTSNINLTSATTCTSPSLITMTLANTNGPDGNLASTVTIQFNTATFIPIPGILPANIPVVRKAQMLIGR